jgi:hypothetical protein
MKHHDRPSLSPDEIGLFEPTGLHGDTAISLQELLHPFRAVEDHLRLSFLRSPTEDFLEIMLPGLYVIFASWRANHIRGKSKL